jgi:hypothetical protein
VAVKEGILPEGWALDKAVRWIGERRTTHPDVPIARVIDEASVRFDLTPVEEAFLWTTLAPEKSAV